MEEVEEEEEEEEEEEGEEGEEEGEEEEEELSIRDEVKKVFRRKNSKQAKKKNGTPHVTFPRREHQE